MSLINFETNLILRWSWTSVVTNSRDVETFTITDTKPYVCLWLYQLKIM